MRKKLDTRFPAARIKKIMQADEDVGKIALAVPVLVSKALELFLQDLCDRTYEITLQRGAKTMSSLHLKHYVQSYNVFDFLREIVSKVPDYSHGHSDTSADHRSLQKRKPAGEDANESDEESKRSRMQEMGHTGSSGRGRGRGRERGRGSKSLERESSLREIEIEHTMNPQQIVINSSIPEAVSEETAEMKGSAKENSTAADFNNPPQQRNFDLNAEVDYEDVKTAGDPAGAATSAAASSSAEAQAAEPKPEEYPGWSLSDMDKRAINPLQIAQLGARIDEDDDYDEEG